MKPKLSLLMIVTDPDIELADSCVASYRGIRGIPFKLVIYSNWVSPEKKRKYFPRWAERYTFVEVLRNDWQDAASKPSDRRLEGPFDRCTKIWDEQLGNLDAEFCGTADADFEILDARLVSEMLALFQASPKCAVVSSDYSAACRHFESYSGEEILDTERWHTWFCIYRREVLRQVRVSHAYHEVQELHEGRVMRRVWDSSGYLQKAIKEAGFELRSLDRQFQHWYMHYGAFSKNRELSGASLATYRFLMVLRKRGWPLSWPLPYRRFPPRDPATRAVKALAKILLCCLFPRVDRSKYWEGWGRRNTPLLTGDSHDQGERAKGGRGA
jgi:hypothetical protein